MDVEILKIGFTAAAFAVSLVSLGISYQTKRQTESESFEDRRATLITLIKKNTNAWRALSQKAANARSGMVLELASPNKSYMTIFVGQQLEMIRKHEPFREGTEKEIASLRNTPSGRARLRQILTAEQVLEATIAQEVNNKVFEEAEKIKNESSEKASKSQI